MKRKVIAALLLAGCLMGTSAYAKDYFTLEVGSRGTEVQELQQALIDQGFLSGAADGAYGNGTAASVSSFQESVGLEATGVADEATQRKLFNDEEEDISGIEVSVSGVAETDYMRINGMFVDESYVSEDSENLTLLYICYSVFTEGENLQVDSKDSELTINEGNTYISSHFPGVARYLDSYYYSDYLKDVYMGDEVKVVETFQVPKAELEAGRKISFVSSQIPDSDKINLITDDIITCGSAKTIARIIDPEGHDAMVYKMSPADEETVSKVKNEINGYMWDFYLYNTHHNIEFYDNAYTLTTPFGTTTGTYTVKNGFVLLVNDSNGAQNYLPYSWEENGMDLDVVKGFDVKEG